MLRRMVILGKRLNCWNTIPTLWRIRLISTSLDVISISSIKILPSVGSSRRLMERRKVLLPQPDGPMMATTSPFLTEVVMPFSTSLSPKRLRSPSILIISFILSIVLKLLPFQDSSFPFALSQSLLQPSHSCVQSENKNEIEAGYYTQRHHRFVSNASDDVGTLGQVYQSDITAD